MIDKKESLKNIFKNLLEERLSYLEKRNQEQMKDLKFEKEAFKKQELLVQKLCSIKIELKKPPTSKINKVNETKTITNKSRDKTPIQKSKTNQKYSIKKEIKGKRSLTPDIPKRNIRTKKIGEKAPITKNKTDDQLIKKKLKLNYINAHNTTKPHVMNESKNNKKNTLKLLIAERATPPDKKLKNKEPDKINKNTEYNLKLNDLKKENVKEPGTKKDKKEEKIETKKEEKTTKQKEEPEKINPLSDFDKIIPKEKIDYKTSPYLDTSMKEEKNIENQKYTLKSISEDINPIDNEKDKNLITVIFKERNNYIEYPMACNDTVIFSLVEDKLYKEHSYLKGFSISNTKMNIVQDNFNEMFPNLMMQNNAEANSMIGNNHIYFYSNGIKVDKSKTLKENNIKDNSVILLDYMDFNPIDIKFILDNPKINYKLTCFDIYLFSTIEQKLYNEFPELEEINILFKVEGNKIDKLLTLKDNNIKNNAIISMEIIDGKKINVRFISIDQITDCTLNCLDSDIFSDIEKKLYKKAPELQKQYYFLCNGSVIEKSSTIAQNNIQDRNIILINEIDDDEEDKSNKLIAIVLKTSDQTINCAIFVILMINFQQ